MIRDEGIARHVSDVMLEINNRLELSVATVREHCPAEEAKQLRNQCRQVDLRDF